VLAIDGSESAFAGRLIDVEKRLGCFANVERRTLGARGT
jgi:hypothetical protein